MEARRTPLPIAGAVLAGGQSRRFGQDKALLVLEGQTLLERALAALRAVAQEVLVIGPPERAALAGESRVVPDAFPGTGPLGAIATALQASHGDRVLLVACDMPFLNVPLLRHLVACSKDYDVTIPRTEGYTEQMHAVYHRSCLPIITAQLATGDFKIDRFFSKVRVRYVDAPELRTVDPDLRSLWNVNTPEDWDEAQRLAGLSNED